LTLPLTVSTVTFTPGYPGSWGVQGNQHVNTLRFIYTTDSVWSEGIAAEPSAAGLEGKLVSNYFLLDLYINYIL